LRTVSIGGFKRASEGESRGTLRVSGRRGASEVGLLIMGFVVLLAMAAGILFLQPGFDTNPGAALQAEAATESQTPVIGITGPVGADGTRVVLGPDGQPVDGLRSGATVETTENLAYRTAPRFFEGTGRLTGEVEGPDGAPFPANWRLVIEPSLYVEGRQHSGPRRVLEFEGNQRTFDVDDLALGAYRVTAEGAGVDARTQEILLFKLRGHGPTAGKTHAHLNMRFHAARGCGGRVLDQAGEAVIGLPVTLIPRTPAGGATRDPLILKTETSGAGSWAFASVTTGSYLLILGSRARPLIEPQSVVVSNAAGDNPSTYREDTVPVTVTMELAVVDNQGRGLPGARVRGTGPSPLDVVADSLGTATAKFLLPGRYQLAAEYEPMTLSAIEGIVLEASPSIQASILICLP
jgi:hypothetical protein